MQDSAGRRYLASNIRPSGDVDWSAAPLRFKLYRNCERIPLSAGRAMPGTRQEGPLDREHLGCLLRDTYGITRLVHSALDSSPDMSEEAVHAHSPVAAWWQSTHNRLLRTVPSGGALYPCELYLYVAEHEELSRGVYHYDALHHALDVLRSGDCSEIIDNALAYPPAQSTACTLLLSCLFWKDGFKYGAFSYRLQGLDIGVVLAQIEVIARQHGLHARIHQQFLDRQLDELLGLDALYESVFVVVTLVPEEQPRDLPPRDGYGAKIRSETTVALDCGAIHAEPFATIGTLRAISTWPVAEAVHSSSMISSPEAFRQIGSLAAVTGTESTHGQIYSLPFAPIDLARSRYDRRSAPGEFVPLPLIQLQLGQLLAACAMGYTSDVDGEAPTPQHTLLYCLAESVHDLPQGVYRYHPNQHGLEPIRQESMGAALQAALSGPPLHNVTHVSVSFFAVGDYESGFEVFGDRWYRMQNMEAGILAQRLYLAAAALGLGCRASLGFSVERVDELLCLPAMQTSLIHVMVSATRQPHRHYEHRLVPVP